MKRKIVGIISILIGFIMLLYTHFSPSNGKKTELVKSQLTIFQKNFTLEQLPITSVLLVVGGIIILISNRKTKRPIP